MPRVKLTQEQEELIAVFPLAITKSDTFKRLSNAQKLVLAQIDLQDGTDFSEENGYTFASNEAMMENTGIRSKNTIISAVKTLVNEGLIVTQRGRRDKSGSMASEYALTDKYYGLCDRENPHKKLLNPMGCNKGCNKNEQGCNNYQNQGCNNSMEGCNKGCNNENALKSQIAAMELEISELKKIINELQNQLQKSYCTPDTDIDIDTCILENVNKNKNSILRNSIKEKKLKRKESGVSGQGIHSEEGLSDFDLSNELNTSMQSEGEQDRQGINETVSLTSKDTGKNFGLHTLQELMELDDVTEDTSTSSEKMDKDTTLVNTSKDIKELQIQTKESNSPCWQGRTPPNCAHPPLTDKVMTKEMATAIIDNLGEYYSEGASIMEHQPHKFMIELAHEIPFMDLTNIVPNYIMGHGLDIKDIIILRQDEGKCCSEFEMYFNN